jgi:hypothetical protein
LSYDLLTDGLEDFKNTYVMSRKKYFRSPLIGIVNGSNTRFTGQFAPWDTDRTPAIYSGNSGFGSSAYTVNYPAGAVTFTSAPASGTLTADYTYIEADDDEITETLKTGFDVMRDMLSVDWDLSDTGLAIYIVNDDGDDPTVNDGTFNTVRAAKVAYMLCCQYAYLRNRAQYTSFHNRAIKSGDVSINNQRNPDQIRNLLKEIRKDMIEALSQLTVDADADSAYGAYVSGERSSCYEKWFMWQDNVTTAPDGETWP